MHTDLYDDLLFPDEFQTHRVDAVAPAGRLWTIIEHVAQVGSAAAACGLGAHHAERLVLVVGDSLLPLRLEKARPATAAREFAVRLEKYIAANSTSVSADAFEIPVLPREGPLGALLESDVVKVFRQKLLPLAQWHVQFARVRVRVVWIVAVVVLVHGIHGGRLGLVVGLAGAIRTAGEEECGQ